MTYLMKTRFFKINLRISELIYTFVTISVETNYNKGYQLMNLENEGHIILSKQNGNYTLKKYKLRINNCVITNHFVQVVVFRKKSGQKTCL